MESACAVTGGRVLCWGINGSGLLGSSISNSYVPMPIAPIAGGVTALSVGGSTACAVTGGGGVLCWGNNDWGQLGDNAVASSAVPVQVPGLTSGVTAVSVGGSSACAVTETGGVLCWGKNDSGQLGSASTGGSSPPVQVVGLTSGVTAVSVGDSTACAITDTGVLCWGALAGQVGGNAVSVPVQVPGLTADVRSVSVGIGTACAVTTAGSVLCWGQLLGSSSWSNSPAPVAVSALADGAIAVSVGASSACAVTSSGGVVCWGANVDGQLGDGTTTSSTAAVQVSGLASGVTSVSVGGQFACARTEQGSVLCWGLNEQGQLGSETGPSALCMGYLAVPCVLVPVPVVGL